MAERIPPPSAMCRVCNRILTPVIAFDDVYEYGHEGRVGQLETLIYRHPAGFDEDHDPDPVPEDMAKAVEICDACSEPEVRGYAICTPFEVTYRGIRGMDDGQWALCSICRTFIERGEWDALTARAISRMVAAHGPEGAGYVQVMHEAFRRSYLGEIFDTPQGLE